MLSPPCRLPCPKGTDGTIRKHHDRIVNELANLFHLCEIANLKVEDGQTETSIDMQVVKRLEKAASPTANKTTDVQQFMVRPDLTLNDTILSGAKTLNGADDQ